MRNANVMQMKCNANKCEKMHNSGSDPLMYIPWYLSSSFYGSDVDIGPGTHRT